MNEPKTSKNLCTGCGGKLRDTPVIHEDRVVPAEVCDTCGEVWVEELVLKN